MLSPAHTEHVLLFEFHVDYVCALFKLFIVTYSQSVGINILASPNLPYNN